MAGGEGTRLRPLTSNLPKPMVPIFNRPIMEYIVELVRQSNINDVVVTLQFMPQAIKNYFGDGSDLSVNMSYSTEQTPLGTAGSVKNAQHHLNNTFVVISGDALTDIDLRMVVEYHRRKKAMATIVLKRVENPLEFGVVITEPDGKVSRFLEKPGWGDVFSDTINTGIYVLEPEVFQYIAKDQPVDFSKDVFPKLLEQGERVYGYIADGYWCDVGNYEQYVQAHYDVMGGKTKITPPGILMGDNIWLGHGAYVDPGASISGPAVIGRYARIESGCEIREFTVIGNNTVLNSGGHTHRSIIWDNVFVGSQAHLHGCVVGRNCDIRANARVEQGAVIGDDCVIGENAVVSHDVKIYPSKTIEGGASVHESIIWESKVSRILFGQNGVDGLAGVDLTPDRVMRMASAFATWLEKDSHVAISAHNTRACRMLKRAAIAGLNAAGVHCRDLQEVPESVNRFEIRTSDAAGGMHLSESPTRPGQVNIAFMEAGGMDLAADDKRNVERYYFRGDFRRVYNADIGELSYAARAKEYYLDALIKAIGAKIVREAGFKIVAQYHASGGLDMLPELTSKLNCDLVALSGSYGSEADDTSSLSEAVTLFNADIGVHVTADSTSIVVVDELGNKVDPARQLLLMLSLASKYEKAGKRAALPLNVSRAAEAVAANYDRRVLRTKLGARELMEASTKRDIYFAGSETGGVIFPKFIPAFDPLIALGKILEYLAREDHLPVSRLVESVPVVHVRSAAAFCPWAQKGTVMRKLLEHTKGKNVELLDGIKWWLDEGWLLIVPHPTEPLFMVYAEAESDAEAESLIETELDFIRSVV